MGSRAISAFPVETVISMSAFTKIGFIVKQTTRTPTFFHAKCIVTGIYNSLELMQMVVISTVFADHQIRISVVVTIAIYMMHHGTFRQRMTKHRFRYDSMLMLIFLRSNPYATIVTKPN